MAIQSSLPLPLFIATTFLRFLQFVFAIAVLGLYGTDINSARKAGISVPSKWVYAEVIGSLSALTALVYCLPKINAKAHLACAWDGILLFVFFFLFFSLSFSFLSFFYFNYPSPLNLREREKASVFVLPTIEMKKLIKT